MTVPHHHAVLLLSCPDQVGLVSRITHFIFERGGNITDLEEHVDESSQRFTIRVAWDMQGFTIPAEALPEAFAPLGREFQADWHISFTDKRPRMAIMVSGYDHCIQDLLWRHKRGELNCVIPLVISNHRDVEKLCAFYEIPFEYVPVSKENKGEQEAYEIELLRSHEVDVVVLARYMQILSERFVNAFPNRIINIHHSFLPAFVGGNPYRQAFERGVKIIGATSHYVTEVLDEGPIIAQDIIRVSHRDMVKDMIRKGRDLERIVLARAVKAHLEKRVLILGRRTVVFD
ncbi:MAG: formyltetrahydrofolate deformylase [Calditrichaeota bacterium]|nr:MAG: formyltetrahydrofolate deformylase [Calditrichota bacterium]